MSLRIAINGYGRIGRSILRALLARDDTDQLAVVAINEPASAEAIALLTQYDSQHGRLRIPIEVGEDWIAIDGNRIQLYPGLPADQLPWGDHGIDLVLDCSGQPGSREAATQHLQAGAGKLLYSQPASSDVDLTLIPGFNQMALQPEHRILSAGSCTTNCLIPVLDCLDSAFGIDRGVVTTIHSAMNDQPVSDTLKGDELRLTRAALNAMQPVDTALARGVERLLPTIGKQLECLHLRVPTAAVSAMDISIQTRNNVSVSAVAECLFEAARHCYAGILDVCEDPVSSIDFAHDPHSVVVDLTQLRVADQRMIKLLCWFDNEWGFANRMIDIARLLAGESPTKSAAASRHRLH